MAISKTTFSERVQTIEADFDKRCPAKRSRSRGRGSRLTFPLIVGVSILVGGTAYAYAATTDNLQWLLDFPI
jgi:hypothetical protein